MLIVSELIAHTAKRTLALLALCAIIWGVAPPAAKAVTYCNPSFSNGCSYSDMVSSFWIKEGTTNLVAITGLVCGTGGAGPGYQTITKPTFYLGTQYAWTCNTDYSSQTVKIWVDWDDDGAFTETNDFITSKLISGTSGGDNITFPEGSKKGTHRVMVTNRWNDGTPSHAACYSGSGYGSWFSFDAEFAVKVPDASISAITFPTSPYTEGSYPIKATLYNSAPALNLTSAVIHWSVNGVEQPTVPWSGTIKAGNSEQITLGNYNLTFGPNGPWDPFDFTVWVTNANGLANGVPDNDPSNDSRSSKTSPAMDDADAVSVLPPASKFGPGVQDVYVQVKNISRKPMTSVKIEWSVDGVAQTTKIWTGSLLKDQTADVKVGSFDFQFKKPLKAYSITARTQDPNGKADEWTSNDAATPRDMAPALVPGTYTIGLPTSHFAKLADMGTYISAIGVFGVGDVTFNIEPGVYNERVKIENTDASNRIFIRSATGSSNDVTWQATTTMGEPYSLLLNNANNINISNINFRFVEPSGYPAFVIAGSGVTGFALNKNIFNGVAGSTSQFAMVSMTNTNEVDIRSNQFLNGSSQLSIMNANDGKPVLMTVKDNLFRDFTRQGVMLEANSSTPTDKIEISKNTVMNNKANKARTAFEVRGHSAIISYNTLENLSAVHAPGDVNAGIKVMAGDAGKTEIHHNEINNVENVNGIYVTGQNADIRKNKILVSSSMDNINGAAINFAGGNIRAAYNEVVVNAANVTNAMNGVQLAAASGYVADNTVVGNNINGALNNGVNGVTYMYNTFNIRCNTNKAIQVNGGTTNIYRNIFVNRGTSKAFDYAAPTTITGGQNAFYSYGASPDDLARWKALTGDQTSTDMKLTFNEDAGTMLGRYVNEIVFTTPLPLPADVDADLQQSDFSGNKRDGFWYAGANGMNLSIAIIDQPKDLLECEGAKNLSMRVVAQVTGGAEAQYQWYKDGQPIAGETKSVYRIPVLTKDNTGIYRCHVYGPANVAAGLDTKELVVYTLGKTSIVKQDEVVEVEHGGKATLNVEAHIKGITAPFFQQRYQWYRRIAGAPDEKLADGEKFMGVNTPNLVIRNVESFDYFDGSLGYVLEVEGQCGKVFSKVINLIPKPGVNITSTNSNVDRCGSDELIDYNVNFEYFGKFDRIVVEHITNNSQSPYYGYKETIDYSTSQPQIYTWGYTTEGMKSSKDNEIQKTRITMYPSGQVWETPEVSWTFHDAPGITTQPQTVTVEEEKEFALTVEADSDSPMTYQWMLGGAQIAGATEKTYYVQSATMAHAGDYSVELTNRCGATTSQAATVVVTPKGIKSANEATARLGIVSISPNPASETIEVGYSSTTEGTATFKILELSGREAMSFTAESGLETRYALRELSNLASGSYLLVMEIGGARFVERFVVVK